MDDEEQVAKTVNAFSIGQSLADLSVDELESLVSALEAEIERLNEAKASKLNHMSAAEALFSKPGS